MANESLQVAKEVAKEVLSKDQAAMGVSGGVTVTGMYAVIEQISSIIGVIAMVFGVTLTGMLAWRAYWDMRLKKAQAEKAEKMEES